MAIVENRSTEIGDVIRIQTEVPIIGVISLTSFIDDTEGEQTSTGTGTIELFDDPRKVDNSTGKPVFTSDHMYVQVRGNDGTSPRKSIAQYDLPSATWDTDFPDSAQGISALVPSGNIIYAVSTSSITEDGDLLIQIDLRRIDVTTRVWQDEAINLIAVPRNQPRTSSDPVLRAYSVVVEERIFDNKIWMVAGDRIISYDLTTKAVTQSSTFRIAYDGMALDTTNEKIYLSKGANGASVDRNDLAIFDIPTNQIEGLTSSAFIGRGRANMKRPAYNETNGLIYALLVGGGGLISYNPVDDTYDTTFPESPNTNFLNISIFQNKIYGTPGNDSIHIFDVATGVWMPSTDASRFFVKQFRWSRDGGLTFSEFMPLTTVNVENIQITQKDVFVVDISYERSGTDPSGELTWNSTTLTGQFQALATPIYDSTIFKGLFDVTDPSVLGWAINVLEKMYQRGLLPNYIDRNREDKDDSDFVAYWFSITHLFAILVYWMRNFENIPASRILLTEFLRNFDITLPFDLNLADEATIYSQRTDEYRRRGTERIKAPATNANEDVNGELLRLIDWKVNDFFLFA